MKGAEFCEWLFDDNWPINWCNRNLSATKALNPDRLESISISLPVSLAQYRFGLG